MIAGMNRRRFLHNLALTGAALETAAGRPTVVQGGTVIIQTGTARRFKVAGQQVALS